MGSPGLQTLSRSGSASFTHPRSYGRTACEEHPSPEQPAVPDLQPVALKAPKHVACSPWFSGSDAPISSRGLRTSAFTGTRALLPGVSCATLDECEENPVVEKSPCTHPATGLSGSGCGSPRLRAAALREASANHPSHLTPGVSIAAWSGCGCVFPGIGPKLRHSGNLWEEPRGGKCCFALQEENFVTQHETSATRNQKQRGSHSALDDLVRGRGRSDPASRGPPAPRVPPRVLPAPPALPAEVPTRCFQGGRTVLKSARLPCNGSSPRRQRGDRTPGTRHRN